MPTFSSSWAAALISTARKISPSTASLLSSLVIKRFLHKIVIECAYPMRLGYPHETTFLRRYRWPERPGGGAEACAQAPRRAEARFRGGQLRQRIGRVWLRAQGSAGAARRGQCPDRRRSRVGPEGNAGPAGAGKTAAPPRQFSRWRA